MTRATGHIGINVVFGLNPFGGAPASSGLQIQTLENEHVQEKYIYEFALFFVFLYFEVCGGFEECANIWEHVG